MQQRIVWHFKTKKQGSPWKTNTKKNHVKRKCIKYQQEIIHCAETQGACGYQF